MSSIERIPDALQYASERQLPGFNYEFHGQWNGPFFFIQGADPQFGMINDYLERKPTCSWLKEIELTNQAIAAVNKMNPEPAFFIVCGDMVHAFPGERHREAQIKDLKQCFSALNASIPLVCICGNHDVGQVPTPASIKDYTQAFGDDYFSFWVSGMKCIVLNTQLYYDCSEAAELREEMDKWLDSELFDMQDQKRQHLVVFLHIPMFVSESCEEDDYFNLPRHIRSVLLDKFHRAGIKYVFCGHYHRNGGGMDGDLECVVTSAIGGQCGTDQSGMRVVKVLENKLCHRYFALDHLPTTVDLQVEDFD